MNNELNTLSSRGYIAIYNFINKDFNELKWSTKKTSLIEEELLFPLKSEINKLVGYVCQCKITNFSKLPIRKAKTLKVPVDEVNKVQWYALYVHNDPYEVVTIELNNKIVRAEQDLLLMIDTSKYNSIKITGNVDILSLSIHEYAL